MSLDDIKIALHDDVLLLSGERSAQREHHAGDVIRAERTYGSFSRMIHLPRDIDGKTAETKLENGVLEITVRAKR
jgi:HSP20 family protein